MSNVRLIESQPTGTQEDIPWGIVQEREALPNISWYSPQGKLDSVGTYERKIKAKGLTLDHQEIFRLTNARQMYLERVVLSNGLRYVVIRDAETGEESFDCFEYAGLGSCNCGEIHDSSGKTLAEALHDVDLGNGYTLKSMVAEKVGEDTPMSSSYVIKDFEAVDTAGLQINCEFQYQIDPHQKYFTGTYTYNRGGEEGATVWMKNKDRNWISNKGEATKKNGQKISYSVCITDLPTNDQINFLFGNEGSLEEIQLLGKRLLNTGEAEKELLALTEDSRRGVVHLRGEELKTPRVRMVVRKLLGVDFGDVLALDTKGTLENLVQNADLDLPKNPREILSFLGSTRVANWQPALLES